MYRKKAAVEIQFNWIFVLIAGAAILMLFATIMVKQKSSADATARATLLRTMSSLAIGAETSPGITNVLELPKATLNFECNRIRVSSSSQPFSKMMLFAPWSVQTPQLVVHTKEWSIPYHVANVVYLSSPQIHYILVADASNTAFASTIQKLFPDKLSVEIVLPSSSFTYENDEHVRVVYLNSAPAALHDSFENVDDKSVTAVSIIGNINSGTATFYQKTGTSWGFGSASGHPYLGPEMLLGAIFASAPGPNTEENYACIATNIKQRATIVTEIYSQRTTSLIASQDDSCDPDYEQGRVYLDTLADTFNSPSSDLTSAANAMAALKEANHRLEKLSCPLLY